MPQSLLRFAALLVVCSGLAGCFWSGVESGGTVGRISNGATEAVVVMYWSPNGNAEPVSDQPLPAGQITQATRPFDRHHDELVDGCLPGHLSAATQDGRIVATIAKFCVDSVWEIRFAAPGGSIGP